MRLLFDHNLSFKLIAKVSDQFADSSHVYYLDLSRADDLTIWDFAEKNEYTIVTKDTDFFDLVSLKGFPPKVIWIKRDNCSTNEIATILAENSEKIKSFIEDSSVGILIVE